MSAEKERKKNGEIRDIIHNRETKHNVFLIFFYSLRKRGGVLWHPLFLYAEKQKGVVIWVNCKSFT